MSLNEFQPDSPFGVPLNPFPPGLPWSDVKQMLQDALFDLKKQWVREYLLKEDPVFDVSILNDPSKMSQTMPIIFQATTLPNMSAGFSTTIHNVRLNWPSFSVGKIGAGIAVETADGIGSHEVIFTRPWRFMRYVANQKRAAQLTVSFREEQGTVELVFMRYLPSGLWSYALLIFNLEIFKSAFTGKADFDLAHAALMQSIVGGVPRKYAEYNLVGRYPYKIFDNYGRHFFRSVIASYMNTKPMMVIPIFAEGYWSFDIDASKLSILQKWGMGNRLRRITLGPITMPDPHISESQLHPVHQSHDDPSFDSSGEVIDQVIDFASSAENQLTPPHPVVHFESNDDEFRPIAPAVTLIPRQMSETEKKELEENEKMERRKIQKREAAARSNAKRSLELKEKRRQDELRKLKR